MIPAAQALDRLSALGAGDDATDLLEGLLDRGDGPGVAPLHVDLPAGTFKLTRPLRGRRVAATITGAGIGSTADFTPRPGEGTTLVWAGPDGQPMVELTDSAWCRLYGLAFMPGPGRPSAAISLLNPGGATVGTNRDHEIERVYMGPNPWAPGGRRGGFEAGLVVGGRNGNNDQVTVRHVHARDCGIGFHLPNTQSIWNAWDNVHAERCGVGVLSAADLPIGRLWGDRNGTDVVAASTARVTVGEHGSENSQCAGAATDNGGQLAVLGGRITLTDEWTGDAPVYEHQACGGGGMLTLERVTVVNQTGRPHRVRVRGNTSSSRGVLRVRHCKGITPARLDVTAGASKRTAGVVVDFSSFGEVLDPVVLTGNAALETS